MRRPESVTWGALLAGTADVFGTWSQIASADIVDMLGAAGYDFTIIDCEHGTFGLDTAEGLIRACRANGIAPFVRVPANDAQWIGKSLDTGAVAIVVPGVESGADVERAVAATRFAPDGTRGACPCIPAGDHYVRDWRAWRLRQQSEVGIIALVETRAGLDSIDAICRAEDLNALLVGPFDLSVSLGHDGDYRHPEVQSAVERLIAAAQAHRVPVLMPVFSPEPSSAREQIDHWRRFGIRMFVVGTDKILVADQFQRYLARLRG